jgi:RNA polymerase sigma factor (sigma-70 family)
MYVPHTASLNEYLQALPRLDGQAGAIVGIAGELICLDFVSRSEVFAGLYLKLLRGYALSAIERPLDRPLRRRDLGRFLGELEPTIIGRCIAELRGHLDADDVAQDVKVRLWTELRKGKTYSVPFRVVVHNVVRWTLKATTRAARRMCRSPTTGIRPTRATASRLLDRDAVLSVLDELDEGTTRQVMELRYIVRLEIDEIAERLGMTRNAVDQALHRGHRKLRETLTGG